MNTGKKFLGILPTSTTLYALVVEHRADGRTSIIQFPGGSQCVVLGQQVAEGSNALVRSGEIVGEAPAVSFDTLEV